MAKKKLEEPVREVAQLVVYRRGSETAMIMRYHDRKQAEKDFERLMKAADTGKGVSIAGPAATMVFRDPSTIDIAYLVDVETSNWLMADTQKRMNAMMQA